MSNILISTFDYFNEEIKLIEHFVCCYRKYNLFKKRFLNRKVVSASLFVK